MALARRSGQKFQASIWPGFVDAMTALLLVLMFVLTIFMVVQFVLKETITGQESELVELGAEVQSLADALGLERGKTKDLEGEVSGLQTALFAAQEDLKSQSKQIVDFEAQVLALLGTQRENQKRIGALETETQTLADEKSAMELALATARSEIDSNVEAARLAAAKRQALEALIADLKVKGQEKETALTQAEQERLLEAEAAKALRARLKTADAELTAMTLALEEKRAQAEETLTLLAAARLKQREVEGQKLSEAEKQAALLALAQDSLSKEEAKSAESLRKVEALNAQIAALRSQLGSLQDILDASRASDADANVQITALGSQLNAALARAAAEEKRRRVLEEERAENLERYKSEFFGKLRDLLGAREGVRVVGDRFVFSSEVLFASGGAELSEAAKPQLSRVAQLLQDVADDIPEGIDWVLRVDGHTDNIAVSGYGKFYDNWELSQARALSVVRYLVAVEGMDPSRMAAAGFGEYQPINRENTPQARAQNRRIELKFTEK
ncbi:MAG: peptidoglycan -binding protein [Halocynthiibacter sp.]